MRHPLSLYLLGSFSLSLVFLLTASHQNGTLVPPLDDALIHFRYATVLAEGHPFEFVAGEGYTSGATSMLWPLLLAPAAALGLRGLALYPWAIILSTTLLAFAAWFTERWLGRVSDAGTARAGAVALLLCGPLAWGGLSGMEVTLMACAIAAVLDQSEQPEIPVFPSMFWLGVLSLSRPEGLGLALAASLAFQLRWRRVMPWTLSAGLGVVQPVLNKLYTGMWISASVLSKQNPRMPHPGEVSTLGYLWQELIWGSYGDWFFGGPGPIFVVLGAIGLGWLLQQRRPLPLFFWLLPMAGMAATVPVMLNNGRYLMPGLVIWLPAVVVGARLLEQQWLQGQRWLTGTVLVAVGLTIPTWANMFSNNMVDIRTQHVAAASWLSLHTPADATVAVNDAGFVPSLAERKVLDLEGIVSARALSAALAGEGSTLALLRREKPEYVALFPAWFPGLFQSGAVEVLWRSQLARRTISGSDTMAIGRFHPEFLDNADILPYLLPGEQLRDVLDVSDLESEAAHAYHFNDQPPLSGRSNSIVRAEDRDGNVIVEGARRHSTFEEFTLSHAQNASRLVARLGSSSGVARLRVSMGDGSGGWEIPMVPEGRWVEGSLKIPPSSSETLQIRIEAEEVAPGITGGWQVGRWWLVGPE